MLHRIYRHFKKLFEDSQEMKKAMFYGHLVTVTLLICYLVQTMGQVDNISTYPMVLVHHSLQSLITYVASEGSLLHLCQSNFGMLFANFWWRNNQLVIHQSAGGLILAATIQLLVGINVLCSI